MELLLIAPLKSRPKQKQNLMIQGQTGLTDSNEVQTNEPGTWS